MAQAAVTPAPGYKPQARAELASLASSTFSTSRVEISSTTSRHDGQSVFGPAERPAFTALSNADDQASTSVSGTAVKRQAFAQTYNVAESAGFPTAERESKYSLRRSSRELDCLTSALYYEARGEGQAGMEAVAQVIVNRARHPDFPKTLCGVIYQGAGKGRGCQFSFVCDGSMRRRTETALWDRARVVAERAMDERVSPTVGSSTFFHATRISPNWRGLTRVATVGRHVFYRHAGARGSERNLAGGLIGDFGGRVELASVEARDTARVYKVAAKSERPARTVRASYRAAPEAAPYAVAQLEPVTIADDSQPTETLSLDAIVDATITDAS